MVLTSISAEVLDQGLSKTTSESNRKRAYRLMDMLLHQSTPTDPSLQHPLYVPPLERDKLETVEAISNIDNKIIDIYDGFNIDYHQVYPALFTKLLKNMSSRKSHHIQFLQDMTEIVNQMETVNLSLLEEEDEEGLG